jgi:hypothetical protein
MRNAFDRAFPSRPSCPLWGPNLQQWFKVVWRFACHFRRILRNRTATCTRVRSLPLLDSACGYAALTVAADDKEVLTVEFKVNLLAPAAGEVFAARAQVKKAGRTLTVCTADAFAINGGKQKAVATMLATIMAVPITPAR